jgi:hypothetical protein
MIMMLFSAIVRYGLENIVCLKLCAKYASYISSRRYLFKRYVLGILAGTGLALKALLCEVLV